MTKSRIKKIIINLIHHFVYLSLSISRSLSLSIDFVVSMTTIIIILDSSDIVDDDDDDDDDINLICYLNKKL